MNDRCAGRIRLRLIRPRPRRSSSALIAFFVIAGAAAFAADSERDAKEAFQRVLDDAKADDKMIVSAAIRLREAEAPKGVESLVTLGLARERRIAGLVELVLGKTTDPRSAKAIAKALDQSKDAREKLILCRVLAVIPGDDATKSLVKQLSAKEDAIRATAAASLGQRKDAKTARSPLENAIKNDKSARVRAAAWSALDALGVKFGQPPAPIEWNLDGTPNRFEAARVAFLFDESGPARERTNEDPAIVGSTARADAAPVATPAKASAAPKHGPKKPVAAAEVMAATIASAIVRLPEDGHFAIAAFGPSVRQYEHGRWENARGRALDDAASWLKAPRSDDGGARGREVLRALKDALAQDPAPDEVWVFIAGPPDARDPVAEAKTLAEDAWAKGARVNAVTYVLPEKDKAENERDKLERKRAAAEFQAFVSALTAGTSGRAFSISLAPYEEPKPEAKPGAKPGPGAPDTGKLTIKLDAKNKAHTDEVARVKKRFADALKAREAETIATVAACPDENIWELARKEIGSTDPVVVDALIDGFGKNSDADARKQLLEQAKNEKDPGRSMNLARALAAQKGAEATKAIAIEAGRREGDSDVARVLLEELAKRPADELKAISTSDLSHALKNRTGVAGVAAAAIAAKVKGGSAPDEANVVAKDQFLPEKWVKTTSVAIIVDVERDGMETPFLPPPPKSEDPPITRIEAVRKDLARAIEALSLAQAKANFFIMGDGASWQKKAQTLPQLGKAAKEWATGIKTEPTRDPLRTLERALEDTDVESIWVITCGLPVRAATQDREAIHARFRELERVRRVPVHVIAVLGPIVASKGQDTEKLVAERKDLESALEAFWGPIAREVDGSYERRDALRGLEQRKPKSGK